MGNVLKHGKYSDSERTLQYNPDDNKTEKREWLVAGKEDDMMVISSTILASGLHFYLGLEDNKFHVTASIDQMTILFNLCHEIRFAGYAAPKKTIF